MTPCKRVEIITNSLEAKLLCDVLRNAGVSSFSIFPNVAGYGRHGIQDADEITGAFQNSCILIACAEADAKKIVDIVQPHLASQGGICIVSDAYYTKNETS